MPRWVRLSITTLSLFVVAAAGSSAAEPLNSCLLVVGGLGPSTGSEKVTRFWRDVNAEVARSLVKQLTADQVAAKVEVLPNDAARDKVPGLVGLALARERCGLLLQLAHELGGGSGPDAYFAFEPGVFGVQEAKGGFKIGKESFRKKYRFAMTEESLRNLKVSEIASSIKGDLETAGVLKQASAK
jgi:hypothetical protein